MSYLKRVSVLFSVIVLSLFGISNASGFGKFIPELPISGKPFSPPVFIKRGFVAIYDSSYKRVQGGRESVSTSMSVFLVTYADAKRVVGQLIIIPNITGLISAYDFEEQGRMGSFFMNPEFLVFLKKKPYTWVEISGNTVHFKTNNSDSVITYNSKGLMVNGSITRSFFGGIERSVILLKWNGYVELPPLPQKFPQTVAMDHYYTISTILTSWTGAPQENVIGQVHIVPGESIGQVMKFRQTFQGNTSMNFPETKELIGSTLRGPFYIHPDYLATLKTGMIIMSIPAVNLFYKVTNVDNNIVRIDNFHNGKSVNYAIYQRATGLLVMQVTSVDTGGIPLTIIYRLSR